MTRSGASLYLSPSGGKEETPGAQFKQVQLSRARLSQIFLLAFGGTHMHDKSQMLRMRTLSAPFTPTENVNCELLVRPYIKSLKAVLFRRSLTRASSRKKNTRQLRRAIRIFEINVFKPTTLRADRLIKCCWWQIWLFSVLRNNSFTVIPLIFGALACNLAAFFVTYNCSYLPICVYRQSKYLAGSMKGVGRISSYFITTDASIKGVLLFSKVLIQIFLLSWINLHSCKMDATFW